MVATPVGPRRASRGRHAGGLGWRMRFFPLVVTGALSVLPSVTYPAHTTIATGVFPARHGIVTNYAWDPVDKNLTGWWWYAEDIRAPTLWDAARAAGRKVALIDWPVTVGAKVDVLVPEYWRAGTP